MNAFASDLWIGVRTGPARAGLAFSSLALGLFAVTILLATLEPGLVMPALYLFGLGWGGNYTMLQGLMVIYCFLIVVVNLVTDLLYGVINPKVRYE